jgi:hypothetical protein
MNGLLVPAMNSNVLQMNSPEVLAGLWDLAKMVITAVLGVLTFVGGQIFMKLAEPVLALRGHIGTIKGDLLMYANRADAVSTPKQRMITYRKHAAKIHELVALIVGYDVFAGILRLPPKGAVLEAASQLISLSNAQIGSDPQWYLGQYVLALLGLHKLSESEKDGLRRLHIPIPTDI